MKLEQLFNLFKNNFLTSVCFILLFLLCSYQTWLRKKDNTLINELNRNINIEQDKKYLFDELQFSPAVIDSLYKLNRERLLVLRFVRNDCDECIDSIFSNLSSVSPRIGKENIVVLVDETNLSNYYKYKRLYQENIINFFYCPTQISSIDKNGISYYSIFSKNNKTSSFVFLTRPLDFPSQTNKYLKEVVNVF